MTDGPTDGGTGGQATNLPTRGVMIPALDPDRESDFGWKFVIPIPAPALFKHDRWTLLP